MADTSCKGYRDHDAVLEGFSFDVAQVAVLVSHSLKRQQEVLKEFSSWLVYETERLHKQNDCIL